MNDPPGFLFLDVKRSRDYDALVVRVPEGTRGKRELLELLARELRFPAWFGGNWDALFDCLRDLSWLSPRRIVVLHEAMPLRDEDQRRTYLRVLRDAIATWGPDDAHELIVIFPESSRTPVAAMLQSAG